MISDVYDYHSAQLILDQHGNDAPYFAATQADKLLERGEPLGESREISWKAVSWDKALKSLRRPLRRRNDSVYISPRRLSMGSSSVTVL